MKPAKIAIPTLTQNDRESVAELLGAWLETLTDNARRSYQSDLEHFAAWIGAPDIETAMQALFTLRGPQANGIVLKYRRHLLTTPVWSRAAVVSGAEADRKGYAPATVNRRLAALRSVSKIARMVGVFDGAIEVSGMKVESGVHTRSPISHDDYLLTMRHMDASIAITEDEHELRRLVRDRAVFRLLHDLLLRRVEVQRIDLADLDLSGRELVVRSKGAQGRRDVVGMTELVAQTITAHIELRGPEPGALFLGSAPPEPFALSTVNRIVERRSTAAAGVKARPHDLRRIAITTGLDRTDLRSVARAARHRNPATTMRYDQSAVAAQRSVSEAIGQ